MTATTARRRLDYIEQALPTATGPRRADLEAKAAECRQVLAASCRRCHRSIDAPESLAAGLGSTCRRHAS